MLLSGACGIDVSNHEEEISEQDTIASYHLLIFKKEQIIEIWKADSENTFLNSYKIENIDQLPIGQFELKFDKKNKLLLINFPNEFYKSKDYKFDSQQDQTLGEGNLPEQFFQKIENASISEIIIFPNDNRLGGDLVPCFACPHWMAEIYAFLNLKKKEYI